MKERILALLQNADGFLSGERISEQLGVSRAAVWKAVKKLREEGYAIQSVTNKGYRLVSSPDLLTEGELSPLLTTACLGRTVYSYEVTDSTNRRAREEADRGAPHGSVFFAEEQTGGRGRLGRAWSAPRGEGVWMSVLLRPKLAPADIAQITLLTGLAVCDAIREVTGLPVQIKWPNDIVLDGKKLVGILTEMAAEEDRICALVVGIGVNVNNPAFPEELKDKATSLLLATGKPVSRKELAARILLRLEKEYETFLRQGANAAFRKRYAERCATIGSLVKVVMGNEEFAGTAIGISETGALLVQTGQGIRAVNSGEVSVRGMLGYC